MGIGGIDLYFKVCIVRGFIHVLYRKVNMCTKENNGSHSYISLSGS